MKQRITYSDNGERRYQIDDKDVTAEEFKLATQTAEEARLREMLKEGRAPHGVSDCTFMRDTANGKQFANASGQGDHYRGVAESMGASTTGKKYLSGLARFPGDPEAWVDSRGDVERVLTKRGWGSEGTVNVKPRETQEAPEAGPAMAPDLVEKYATEIAMRDPHPELVDMKDLKEQVVDRMAPKRKSKKATKATKV
jgi:hypothetical protein